MPSYLEQALARIGQFEGSVAWMYRDTVGKVTVGVGSMLPDLPAACALPFLVRGQRATADQIAADFARVDALPPGRPAHFYRSSDSPELAQPAIQALLSNVVVQFESELRTALTRYDQMPDGVKMALLDMAYNLGPAGLLHGYPRLVKAVQSGDWDQASAACYRHGPAAARNAWTRQMFLASVVPSVQARAEGRLERLAYGLVGLAAAGVERLRGLID